MVESLTISLAGDGESAISNELMLDAEGGEGAGGLHYFAPRRLSTAKLGKSGRGWQLGQDQDEKLISASEWRQTAEPPIHARETDVKIMKIQTRATAGSGNVGWWDGRTVLEKKGGSVCVTT
jgi:hypothetical protein